MWTASPASLRSSALNRGECDKYAKPNFKLKDESEGERREVENDKLTEAPKPRLANRPIKSKVVKIGRPEQDKARCRPKAKDQECQDVRQVETRGTTASKNSVDKGEPVVD